MSHTLFVIEDEEELREMMREALELNGYAVVTAAEGQQALDKISSIQDLCLAVAWRCSGDAGFARAHAGL